MHGGAVGCAVEQASLLSRARNVDAFGELTGAQVRAYKTILLKMSLNYCFILHASILWSINTHSIVHFFNKHTQGQYDTDCYVQSVEVRYICAMKGDLQVTCSEDPYAPLLEADSLGKRWSSKTFGKVSILWK